jgi:hypothetical protein
LDPLKAQVYDISLRVQVLSDERWALSSARGRAGGGGKIYGHPEYGNIMYGGGVGEIGRFIKVDDKNFRL